MPIGLDRATYGVTESHLELMVLDQGELPKEFQGYQVVRQGAVDNQFLAEYGFANSSAERFRQAGRVTGFIKEFGLRSPMQNPDGFNFVVATVAHLFDSPDSVVGWMYNVFVEDFQQHVGEEIGEGHELVSVNRLQPTGFFDEVVALKVLQSGPLGRVSSTIIDFRVGRILGVAYVGNLGDHQRLELTTELGLTLEKKIAGVVLGGG